VRKSYRGRIKEIQQESRAVNEYNVVKKEYNDRTERLKRTKRQQKTWITFGYAKTSYKR